MQNDISFVLGTVCYVKDAKNNERLEVLVEGSEESLKDKFGSHMTDYFGEEAHEEQEQAEERVTSAPQVLDTNEVDLQHMFLDAPQTSKSRKKRLFDTLKREVIRGMQLLWTASEFSESVDKKENFYVELNKDPDARDHFAFYCNLFDGKVQSPSSAAFKLDQFEKLHDTLRQLCEEARNTGEEHMIYAHHSCESIELTNVCLIFICIRENHERNPGAACPGSRRNLPGLRVRTAAVSGR